MEAKLTQALNQELFRYGLFNLFNSHHEEKTKVFYEHNGKKIISILQEFYFKKITGIIPFSASVKNIFGVDKEQKIDFYINEKMNAVFQFVQANDNTGKLVTVAEHQSFLLREGVIFET